MDLAAGPVFHGQRAGSILYYLSCRGDILVRLRFVDGDRALCDLNLSDFYLLRLWLLPGRLFCGAAGAEKKIR